MDGSDFRNEWSEFFDREVYDDFGGGMRGMEELGMQGYSQDAMGAGEGPTEGPGPHWPPTTTNVQLAVSDQQYSHQDTYPNIVPNPWAPIATDGQPAVSDQQCSYQDPYPKSVSPSQCSVDPQDRYEHESPYGENSVGLAPFNGDGNMQGVSSDSADHFGPWQASVDHSMLSGCADLPSPKSQGKDVDIKNIDTKNIDIKNIDEICGVTPGKSCFCLLCLYWPPKERWGYCNDVILSPTAVSCRIMGCGWKSHGQKKISYNTFSCGQFIHHVIEHEVSHFYGESANQAGEKIFTCKQEDCKYSTKRTSDIKRHYAARYCKNAKKFPCHIIGCKFSGDHGFARKDKLRDHLKAGHRDMFAPGKPIPGKPVQTIKPKAGISKA